MVPATGYVLHALDLRTHDVGAPLLEHGGDDVDLLAAGDLAQMLAIEPAPRGS